MSKVCPRAHQTLVFAIVVSEDPNTLEHAKVHKAVIQAARIFLVESSSNLEE
jgi:hypothetical protein